MFRNIMSCQLEQYDYDPTLNQHSFSLFIKILDKSFNNLAFYNLLKHILCNCIEKLDAFLEIFPKFNVV